MPKAQLRRNRQTATAQGGAQDGTATEAVTQSESQAEQKAEPSEIQKQKRLTAENQAVQNPHVKATTLRRKTASRR